MLKTRVIPTLLWKDVGLVKGVRFDSWRRVGSILPSIRVYNARDVDELILVDITASREGVGPDSSAISDFADNCFVPLTVGGGVSRMHHIVELLRAGADKVALNSITFAAGEVLSAAEREFGAQCIVASIDYRRTATGSVSCFSHSGTRETEYHPVEWARRCAEAGAGEILLTSIERDGTMTGYDTEILRQVTAAVNIPVIASGGAGSYAHMLAAIKDGGASAVAAASIFHFTEQTPAGAKAALREAGVPVRGSFVPANAS